MTPALSHFPIIRGNFVSDVSLRRSPADPVAPEVSQWYGVKILADVHVNNLLFTEVF
jgi:hypothetical protein